MTRLIRGHVFHVPDDPFASASGLAVTEDGAILVQNGRVAAVAPYEQLARQHPEAEVLGRAGDVLVPGLIDAHVHYPQTSVIGAMGLRLLEWLERRTLPDEARMADAGLARQRARTFLRLLARNGTTTALVFGAHFASAMDAFFEEADVSGLRIAAGLVVSDRKLRAELHVTPERAVEDAMALVERWHRRGRLRYAVTPRFALSCSDAMLEACAEVLRARDDLLFTTHLNETLDEIATVRDLYPGARDYLETYERAGLVSSRSVFAHDVHPSDGELGRLAAAGAAVCHCPSSNMFIGSGLFPLRRHLEAGVRVCLGSDVGGGTGFSILKEGLMAYQGQMLHADGVPLDPARLLWLATGAGARALGMQDEIGDFAVGKAADIVSIRAPSGSTLEQVLAQAPTAEAVLAGVFTLAREDAVASVLVAGEAVGAGEPGSRPAGAGGSDARSAGPPELGRRG